MVTEIHGVRMDGVRVDASASVRIQHEKEVNPLDALEACLSEWFSTTDKGREAWWYSCGDFNIGDLLSGNLPPVELQKKHGIIILPDDTDAVVEIEFDHVLGEFHDPDDK